ncbi:MAG: hypothetical protein BGN83_00280 [Rhizobium sp. 63-7]|nr:MAG: hypothetical protein BGN83_00280 [Rhizobium sp. 63-7]
MGKFKVGDRVRFTKDNPNGGARFGAKGEEFVVTREPLDGFSYGVQVDIKHPSFGFAVSAPVSALELVATAKVNVAAQADTLSDEYGRGSGAPAASNDNAEPAKPKFKVGDWVKWPGNGWLRYYEVTRIEGDSFWIDSFGIPMRYSLSSCDWLVRSATSRGADPTAIVALIEDGQPKPAARPYIHDTVEAATAEANRLAAKHKGQEFGVYVLNGTFQVPKPTYDHEWQRLAAAGQKINAIKELRAITGLGLKSTKDAVEYWLSTERSLATAA